MNARRNRIAAWLLLAAGVAAPHALSAAGEGIAHQAAAEIQAAEEKVRPALVRIHVVSTHYSGGRELKYESAGSGVIIHPDGYLVSNHHVAGHAIRMFCTLHDNQRYEAELVGTDPLTDVAVLKLLAPPGTVFQAAVFGDSDQVEVGDTVLAMGSPMALSQSVTQGIISNTKMVMPGILYGSGSFDMDGENVGSIVRWIGHDADIYGGNSGGALVNLRGEVIGINEIKFGLGGAIPANLARQVAAQLMEGGAVQRSWLGLEVQPQLMHGEPQEGVLVSCTLPDSPAERAGFQTGDLLLSLGGQSFTVRYAEELPLFSRFVADLPRNQPVQAVVRRGGEEKVLDVVPDAWEESRPRTFEFREWGMTARNISRAYAMEKKLPSRDGVLVTSIRPGGPCGDAKPMLQVGAILTHVRDHALRGVEDLRDVTREIVKASDRPVPTLVSFLSGREEVVTVVKVGIPPEEDPDREASKGYLAVSTQVITRDLAPYLGDPELAGVRVTRVHPGSNGERAGLKVGDLILALDGEPVPARRPEDYDLLATLIRQYRVGTTVEFSIRRGAESLTLSAELIRAPSAPREMQRYTDNRFDFVVRDLNEADRLIPELEAADTGALVVSVQQGGWAALGGLAGTDLILDVNGQPVAGAKELEAVMKRLPEEKPKSVILRVRRGIRTFFLELEPDWDGVALRPPQPPRSDT